MQAPIYPVTPLRQIEIILAHCILRIQNKRLTGFSPQTRLSAFGDSGVERVAGH